MIVTRFGLLFLCLVALRAAESSPAEGRIVGGQTAEVGEFPHQVSFRNGNSHYCGGSIIARRTVLLAAHCLTNLVASNTFVVVGTNTLNSGGTTHSVSALIAHPQYNGGTNDVGVVITQTPFVMGPTVSAIAMDTNVIGAGFAAYFSGWGLTRYNGNTLPNNLQKLNTTTVSNAVCSSQISGIFSSDICAFAATGQGACQGDSGGALVLRSNNLLIGVVSRVVRCAKGKPDVFTRVSEYISWINANTV